METYMPGVSTLGGVIGGTFFVRIISAGKLVLLAPTPLKWIILEKIESIVANMLDLKTPRLKECNAPQEEKRNLSDKEIWEILHSTSLEFKNNFEINPAHCTSLTVDDSSLPVDKNFNQFLVLFDEIDWSSKYNLIKNKILDDDNFLIYLHEQYSDLGNIQGKKAKKTFIQENFDQYMSELAQKEIINPDDQTKEKFAAKWVRDQMVELDKVLKDEKRVKGLQRDLDDAMENLSKILPHITSLKNDGHTVDVEDSLLKIAVEGGNYCARGIKRTTSEMSNAIIYNLATKEAGDDSEIDMFEMELKQKLFEERTRIVSSKYDEISEKLPTQIKNDTHVYDLYRLTLSAGFLPLTQQDKNSFNLEQLISLLQIEGTTKNQIGKSLREGIFKEYEETLPSVIEKVTMTRFTSHMSKMIENNTSLTEDQRAAILEYWTDYKILDLQERFQNLMFVMLGIFRKKNKNVI